MIEKLANQVEPVRPMCPIQRCCLGLVVAVVYIGIVLVALGVRGDISQKLAMPLFTVEMLVALAAGLMAALAAHWLSLPDVRQQHWMIWVPVIPFSLLIFLMIYTTLFQPVKLLEQPHVINCATDMLITVSVPAIFLLVLLKLAASTHHRLSALMAIVSVAGFGYLVMRLICPNDDTMHLVLWHYFPSFGLVVVGVILGSYVLKWRVKQ